MPPDDPQSPREDHVSSGNTRRERAPSRAAQERLTGALRDRAEAYRHDASIDLTMVEALVRLDEAEAAVKTLDDHRASLQAMARDLQVVVADAAVEREAESVCEAIADRLGQPHVLPPRLPEGREPSGLRRRVLALTGAAAVVIALVLPTARFSPRTTLTSIDSDTTADEIAAARERLGAAVSWARALRADANAVAPAIPAAAREEIVADKIRTILAAGNPGGSAALSAASPAEITDLTAYREARQSGGDAASRDRDKPRRPLEDVPAPPLVELVPQPGAPLGADVEVDIEAVAAETDEISP